MGPAVAHDAQFIGDRADLTQVVVEGVSEAAEAFGEHAQLALQVGARVTVPAASLHPVELGEDGGPGQPVCPADMGGEACGDEQVESSAERGEQFGDCCGGRE